MTVFVDDMRMPAQVGRLNGRWSHLMADTDSELHKFADRLGLKRSWFQHNDRAPWLNHYDVTDSKRQEAIRLGATPITWRESARRTMALARAARKESA